LTGCGETFHAQVVSYADGGKGNTRGTPQGGVASPLLANIYMHRFLKHWRLRYPQPRSRSGQAEQVTARLVQLLWLRVAGQGIS
jgi:retron-type reverse transcriptase